MKTRLLLVLLLSLVVLPLAGLAQPRKLKIHISVDMEGIAGVVTEAQLGPGADGWEYQRFREFMTAECNAAIQAAFEIGRAHV